MSWPQDHFVEVILESSRSCRFSRSGRVLCSLGADIAIVANNKVTFDFTKNKQNIAEI